MKWLTITIFAMFFPVIVIGTLPPPPDMGAGKALAFVLWLAVVGALAGYGWWTIPYD